MKPHRIILCSLIGALVMGWEVRWVEPPTYGGTLYIALPGDPAFFNANQGPAPGAEAAWIGHNIYNSLLTITPPPELKIVLELAKSWEVLDEGRTYVFHLVEGVKFHDGTDFDAHAAKWNVDRILDAAVNAWVRPYYTEVEGVDVVDTATLRVRMKEPSGAFPMALAGYYQGIPMISPTAFEKYRKDWIRHPVGTGPYIFKEWIPGSRVVLENNPRYFKPGLPYLDALEFRIINDPLVAGTALRSGEIDLMARVPIEHVAALERSPDIRVVTGPEMTPIMGFLNPRSKPFHELRARRAVGGYGIDREEFARAAFRGRAKPLVSVLPPGVPDAIDLNEMYTYRPDEAKRLLKEVGYDENTPLKFTILTGKQDATMAEVAAMIKTQMAKIGVEATVNPLDQTTFGDRVLVKHDFEMAVNHWANLIDINQASVSFFKGVPSDDMMIDDQPLQAMLHQWRRTLDPEGRKRISAGMQRRLADQLEWVSLTTAPFFQAYQNHVKNYRFYNQAYLLLATTWLGH